MASLKERSRRLHEQREKVPLRDRATTNETLARRQKALQQVFAEPGAAGELFLGSPPHATTAPPTAASRAAVLRSRATSLRHVPPASADSATPPTVSATAPRASPGGGGSTAASSLVNRAQRLQDQRKNVKLASRSTTNETALRRDALRKQACVPARLVCASLLTHSRVAGTPTSLWREAAACSCTATQCPRSWLPRWTDSARWTRNWRVAHTALLAAAAIPPS